MQACPGTAWFSVLTLGWFSLQLNKARQAAQAAVDAESEFS